MEPCLCLTRRNSGFTICIRRDSLLSKSPKLLMVLYFFHVPQDMRWRWGNLATSEALAFSIIKILFLPGCWPHEASKAMYVDGAIPKQLHTAFPQKAKNGFCLCLATFTNCFAPVLWFDSAATTSSLFSCCIPLQCERDQMLTRFPDVGWKLPETWDRHADIEANKDSLNWSITNWSIH